MKINKISSFQKLRNSGIQESRNSGIQEFRHWGIQEFWNSGMQEFRNSGIQEFRNPGIQDFRISGIQGSGILEFRSSGIQEFKKSGIQEFRKSGNQEIRNSGIQEFRKSRNQEFRNSGNQEFRNSGFPLVGITLPIHSQLGVVFPLPTGVVVMSLNPNPLHQVGKGEAAPCLLLNGMPCPGQEGNLISSLRQWGVVILPPAWYSILVDIGSAYLLHSDNFSFYI